MILIEHLYKSFSNNPVLEELNLELKPAEIVGLIGPSGAGKSVLMKLVAGVDVPDSGSINLNKITTADISFMFQEGALFDSLNVFENVSFPLTLGRSIFDSDLNRFDIVERVKTILAEVGLSAAIWKMPGQLSGGMRRRVALARALVAAPRYVLLDDPTAGLDPVASSVIMNLIKKSHAKLNLPGMLIVSHDLRRLLPIVDRVLYLDTGKIIFDGKVTDFEQAPANVQSFVSCRYTTKVA